MTGTPERSTRNDGVTHLTDGFDGSVRSVSEQEDTANTKFLSQHSIHPPMRFVVNRWTEIMWVIVIQKIYIS
jgi:hypothetical protein